MLRRVALTRVTRHNIPEGGILQSHSRENLKSYNSNVIGNYMEIADSIWLVSVYWSLKDVEN
jgi:hypothetical protein